MKEHTYSVNLMWTGNTGEGTAGYTLYKRDYTLQVKNKEDILGSSDPSFRGDAARHNPEELFVASLSSCHMLWYLHLCSVHKITVVDYIDFAEGVMVEAEDGSGHFKSVTLKPEVKILESDKLEEAAELHKQANKMCFIANSCNFSIQHQPKITV